ncbi:MAG: replication protein [Pseudomonadota bacterium]
MSKFIPNSFQLANAVVDYLLPLVSGHAIKCYLVVVRQTTGWNKESDKISLSQLEAKTGIQKRTIQRAMSELIEHKAIERVTSKGKISEYKLANNPLMTGVKYDTTGKKPATPMSLGSVTGDMGTSDTSDTLQKTTIQKTTFTKGKEKNRSAFDRLTDKSWAEGIA